jgi:hypothetical protein
MAKDDLNLTVCHEKKIQQKDVTKTPNPEAEPLTSYDRYYTRVFVTGLVFSWRYLRTLLSPGA